MSVDARNETKPLLAFAFLVCRSLRFWWRPAVPLVLGLMASCGGGSSSPAADSGSHTVGGSVKGLLGQGLILQLNDGSDLSVDLDRGFRFADPVPGGSRYAVRILSQPFGQQCRLDSGATGTVSEQSDSVVQVSCAPLPSATALTAVTGTVHGLTGPGLSLALHTNSTTESSTVRVDKDGSFTFARLLPAGSDFAVSVRAPLNQLCGVFGAGTGSTKPMTVTCTAPTPFGVETYTIGGTVTGTTGADLPTLMLNGKLLAPVHVGGAFTFLNGLRSGSEYEVTVVQQPNDSRCAISNGSGVVGSAPIGNVAVRCKANLPEPTFQQRVTIEGLVGSGLKIQRSEDTMEVAAGAKEVIFPPGSASFVGIVAQPTNPAQACIDNQSLGGSFFNPNSPIRIRCVASKVPAAGNVLALDREAVAFSGEQGATVAPQSVFFSWAGGDPPARLQARSSDPSTFEVNRIDLSSTSGQLMIRPASPGALSAGVHLGTITIAGCLDFLCTETAEGTVRTIQVSYTVQANRPAPALRLSSYGFSFAAAVGASRLRRTLTVGDIGAAASGWRAATEAPWLSVTPSGIGGGELAVTADPAGLPEGFHQASITVQSDDPAIPRAETVRVGLYKSAAPRATRLVDQAFGEGEIPATMVDPIRPVFYRVLNDTVVAYHAYTGQRTGTLQVPAASFGAFALSGDGARMYLLDDAAFDAQGPPRMVVVDLDTFSVHNAYALPQFGANVRRAFSPDFRLEDSIQMVHAVVDGRRVLILNDQDLGGTGFADLPLAANPILDAATGAVLGTLPGLLDDGFPSERLRKRLVSNSDLPVVYATEVEGFPNPSKLRRFELRSNSAGNVFGVPVGDSINYGSGIYALALSADANRVAISADFSGAEVMFWNGTTHQQEVTGLSRIEITFGFDFVIDGRLLARREFHPPSSGGDGTPFDLYDPGGALVKQFIVNHNKTIGMPISSDGFTLLAGDDLVELPQ